MVSHPKKQPLSPPRASPSPPTLRPFTPPPHPPTPLSVASTSLQPSFSSLPSPPFGMSDGAPLCGDWCFPNLRGRAHTRAQRGGFWGALRCALMASHSAGPSSGACGHGYAVICCTFIYACYLLSGHGSDVAAPRKCVHKKQRSLKGSLRAATGYSGEGDTQKNQQKHVVDMF